MCCTRWVCHHLCKTWKDGEERGRVDGCAGRKVCADRRRRGCGAVDCRYEAERFVVQCSAHPPGQTKWPLLHAYCGLVTGRVVCPEGECSTRPWGIRTSGFGMGSRIIVGYCSRAE